MSETLKAKIRHQRLARTIKIDEIKAIEQVLEMRKQEKRKFDEGPCGFCEERAPKRQKIEAPARKVEPNLNPISPLARLHQSMSSPRQLRVGGGKLHSSGPAAGIPRAKGETFNEEKNGETLLHQPERIRGLEASKSGRQASVGSTSEWRGKRGKFENSSRGVNSYNRGWWDNRGRGRGFHRGFHGGFRGQFKGHGNFRGNQRGWRGGRGRGFAETRTEPEKDPAKEAENEKIVENVEKEIGEKVEKESGMKKAGNKALRFDSLQEHKRSIDYAYRREVIESDDEEAVWIGPGSGPLNPKDTFE